MPKPKKPLRPDDLNRDQLTAMHHIVLRCADWVHGWDEEDWRLAIYTAQFMCSPPRIAPPDVRRAIDWLLQRYKVTDWPMGRTGLRRRMLDRLRMQFELQEMFNVRDPDGLIMQPNDASGWNRMIDHALTRERSGSRIPTWPVEDDPKHKPE